MDAAEVKRLIAASEERVLKRVRSGEGYQQHAGKHRVQGGDPLASTSGGAPSTASYVTTASEAGLSAERVLTAGTGGITVVDGGAGTTVTLNVHKHELVASVDGTVTTQKLAVRCHAAGTITGVFCKTADAKTTSTWVGDIFLVTLANANTDGGTTSIFTTKPAIISAGMYKDGTAGLNGTQTVAVGDWLVFSTNAADAALTFVTMVVEVRFT